MDSNAKAWRDLVGGLRMELIESDVLDGKGEGLAYREAPNKNTAVEALRWANDHNYDVVLTSHGTTKDDNAAYIFAQKVSVAQFISEMNEAVGSKVLSIDTPWYKCNFTYGAMKPEAIWQERAEIVIKNKLYDTK